MKKLLIIILLALMLCGCSPKNTYAKSTVVSYVDYDSNTVYCIDYNGNYWSFYGCEDWCIGDICSMIMSDNNTPDNIYDDEIISCHYDGYTK